MEGGAVNDERSQAGGVDENPGFAGGASLQAGLRGAAWMAKVGLACGVLYAFGGLVYDLATVGPNLGTALAFMALIGMPALGAVVGFALGVAGHWLFRRKWSPR